MNVPTEKASKWGKWLMIERSRSCSCKGKCSTLQPTPCQNLSNLSTFCLEGELSLSSVELSSLTEVVLYVLNKQTVLSNKFVEALSHPPCSDPANGWLDINLDKNSRFESFLSSSKTSINGLLLLATSVIRS